MARYVLIQRGVHKFRPIEELNAFRNACLEARFDRLKKNVAPRPAATRFTPSQRRQASRGIDPSSRPLPRSSGVWVQTPPSTVRVRAEYRLCGGHDPGLHAAAVGADSDDGGRAGMQQVMTREAKGGHLRG